MPLQNNQAAGMVNLGIDEEKQRELLELSDGSPELLLDLLEKYQNTARELLSRALTAASGKDFPALEYCIHTLKGSTLSLGLIPLGEFMTELNFRARNSPDSITEADLRVIDSALSQIPALRQRYL